MPDGPVSHDTSATQNVGSARLSEPIDVPADSLNVGGTNVLAVEVHQAADGHPDLLFGGELFVTEHPRPPQTPPQLRLNEMAGSSADGFWVELINIDQTPVSLNGYVLQQLGADDRSVILPDVTLQPGETWQVSTGPHALVRRDRRSNRPLHAGSGHRARCPDGRRSPAGTALARRWRSGDFPPWPLPACPISSTSPTPWSSTRSSTTVLRNTRRMICRFRNRTRSGSSFTTGRTSRSIFPAGGWRAGSTMRFRRARASNPTAIWSLPTTPPRCDRSTPKSRSSATSAGDWPTVTTRCGCSMPSQSGRPSALLRRRKLADLCRWRWFEPGVA